MKRREIIFILACQCLAGNAQADATLFGAEAALIHESNIGRSEYSHDIQEDTALQIGTNISRSMRLSSNSGVAARAGMQLARQVHYGDLSQLALSAGARYRIQPVPGFTAPWIDLSLDVARLEYSDSKLREGWTEGAGIAVGKYFTDRLRASAGWQVDHRNAEENRVFDLHNRQWHLDLDFRLSPQGTLYGRAARIFGDQVSTAVESSFSNSPLRYSAKAQDTALSEHNMPRNAYRFDAVVNTLELGYNYAISGNTALDASVHYFDANAKGGHTYEGYSVRAGVLYQF